MEHAIHCGIEAFWRNFLDDAFQRSIFRSELGFSEYRVSERSDQEDCVRRRVEITPKLNMPGAVEAVLGAVFSFSEEGELRDGVYRFKMMPGHGFRADSASCEGSMRAVATPEGWTNRILDVSIEVRIFGVGGMLESFASKAAQQTYEAHANALNAALAEPQKVRW
jgi:hypothetical protein